MAVNSKKKSFIFNVEWQEILLDYPAEVRLEVYDAIIEYVATGTLSELKPMAKMAFSFIKKEIDYNTNKYNDIVAKRSEAGKKGMASRYVKGNTGNGVKTTNVTNDNKTNKCCHDVTNVTVYDNDNVYDNDLKETSLSRSKEKEEDFGKDVDKPLTELREELLSNQTWIETLSMNNHIDESESRLYIEAYIRKLQNEGIARKSVSDAQQHFARWLIIELKRARDEQSGIHQKPNSKTKQERYAEFAEAIATKLATGDTGNLQDGGESALPF